MDAPSHQCGRASAVGNLGIGERFFRSRMTGEDLPQALPLCVDIADPTPDRGFDNAERSSFTRRMPVDLVVALALLHHLALGRNIPLSRIAAYFSKLTKNWLIVEFIPVTDPKATDLLRNRRRLHTAYDRIELEQAFAGCFTTEKRATIPGTERILYLMRKRNDCV